MNHFIPFNGSSLQNNLDGILAIAIILAMLAGTLALWLFSELYLEVNRRLPPERRIPRKTIGHWGRIIRAHQALCPDHRGRRILWYALAATVGLTAIAVARIVALGGL